MHVLLVYDITSDQLRTKIADICLDYGLQRVQYSVFQGELMQKVKRKLGKSAGSVILYPLCQRDLALKREVANRGGAPAPAASAPF